MGMGAEEGGKDEDEKSEEDPPVFTVDIVNERVFMPGTGWMSIEEYNQSRQVEKQQKELKEFYAEWALESLKMIIGEAALYVTGEVALKYLFKGGKYAYQLYRFKGMSSTAAEFALTDLKGGGGHAIRHLRTNGIIRNSGTLMSQMNEFRKIAEPILTNPTATYKYTLRGIKTMAYEGYYMGKRIVIYVAKEGPKNGKILSSAVIP